MRAPNRDAATVVTDRMGELFVRRGQRETGHEPGAAEQLRRERDHLEERLDDVFEFSRAR